MPARSRELAQRHAAFGLGADVDDGEILLDADDDALDDGSFLRTALGERLFEHCGEILTCWCGGSSSGGGHELSQMTVGASLVMGTFANARPEAHLRGPTAYGRPMACVPRPGANRAIETMDL